MARQLGEINASSMADIAFLLLIFFLVTTTMEVDTGIARMLPPMPEEEQLEEQDIKERNIFTVLVNKNDRLLVEGQPMDIVMLREKAKEFISNPNNDPNLPESEVIEVEYFGAVEVGKGVISLRTDRGTSYNMYMKVQNELVAAYNELRDALSMSRFGRPFDDLDEEQQRAVQRIYPQRISEAEPSRVGGN